MLPFYMVSLFGRIVFTKKMTFDPSTTLRLQGRSGRDGVIRLTWSPASTAAAAVWLLEGTGAAFLAFSTCWQPPRSRVTKLSTVAYAYESGLG